MLQVRNLPDDVHEELRRRAKGAGMSLSEFVARELRRVAVTPTLEELFVRAEARGSRLSLTEATDIVRVERDARS